METTIWVDAWQMQCCGEPFSVGSRVTWTLAGADSITSVLGDSVTVHAAEEHHGGVPDGTQPTEAKVTAISAVHCRHAPAHGADQRTLYPVPSSAVLTPLLSADGRTRDRDDLRFVGYLVHLAT